MRNFFPGRLAGRLTSYIFWRAYGLALLLWGLFLYGWSSARGRALGLFLAGLLLPIPLLAETVKLAWELNPANENIFSYSVYRSDTPDLGFVFRGLVLFPNVHYSETLPDDGKTYYYVVRATRGSEESRNSNEVSVKTVLIVPAVTIPKNLKRVP